MASVSGENSRGTADGASKDQVIYVSDDDEPNIAGKATKDQVICVDDDIPSTADERCSKKRAAPGASSSNATAIFQKKKAAKRAAPGASSSNATAISQKKKAAKRAAPGASSSNATAISPPDKSQKKKAAKRVAPGASSSNETAISPPDKSQKKKAAKRVAPVASSSNETAISPPDKSQKKKASKLDEKRDGRLRTITNAINDRIARALGQRMFLIDRKDTSTEGSLGQEFTVLGSTGNVYKVKIEKHPTCDCPDHMKGNLCKHILYVFLKVLRTPRDSYIICQRALLQHELKEVFSQAPKRNERVRASAAVRAAYAGGSSEEAAGPSMDKRRSIDEEPCSICFDDFSKLDDSQGKVVWCESGCGHNFHKQCMQMWLGSKHEAAQKTCPLCRTLWPVPKSAPGNGGSHNEGEEGYVNLGQLQPGVSTERDTSTYSEWGYSRYRRGWF